MGNLFGKKKQAYEKLGVEVDDLISEEEAQKKPKTHTRVLLTLLPYLWPKAYLPGFSFWHEFQFDLS